MTEQDVGIRISANTTQAEQSIQDLESTLNGLQDLQQKGIGQGFLNDEDIQHFQTLSDQATQIYQNFYQNYEQIINNLNDKRNQLRQQISQSSDQTDIDELRRRVNDIDLQRVTYSSQRTMADNMNMQRGTVFQGSQPYINGTYTETNPSYSPSFPSGPNGGSGGGSGSNNGNGSSGGSSESSSGGGLLSSLNGLAGFISGITGFSFIRNGMQQINDQESQMAQLGTRTGGFGNRFDQGRLTAGRIGYANGYTSQQTIDLADEYSSLAGVSSPNEMWNRVQNIQAQSRQLGVSDTQLGQSEGQMAQYGALGSTTDQQQFADMIAGAIHQDNMQGRQGEFINATSGLVEQSANGQASFSNSQVQNIVGLQATVGQAGRMFQGQNGAQVLGTMNSQIQSNNSNMQIMLGMGTRYHGVSGLLQEQRMAAQGISNPRNLSTIFHNVQHNISGEDNQEIALEGILGLTAPQVDALYRNRHIRQQIESGDMSSREIHNLIRNGSSTNSQNGQNYNSSNAGQRARNENIFSEIGQMAASPFDWAGRQIGNLFGNSGFMQHLGGLGIDIGALWGGRRLFNGARNLFGGGSRSAGRDFSDLTGGVHDAWDTARDMWNRSSMGHSVNEDFGNAGRWFSNTHAGQFMGDTWDTLSHSRFGQAASDFAGNFRDYLNPRNLMNQAGRDLRSFGEWGSEGSHGLGDIGRLGGGLLSGAGRVLGPIGDIQMFREGPRMANGFWDWALGHRAGQHESYTGINPFHGLTDSQTYSSNREGAIQGAWHWLTESRSGSSFGAASTIPPSTTSRRTGLTQREEDLEQKRSDNLDHRERLDNQEETDMQKKDQNSQSDKSNNSNPLSRMMGGSSSGGENWFGQMFRGIGGFFSNMFSGIGSMFGGGSSTDQMRNGTSGATAWASEIESAAHAEGVNLTSSELHTIEQRISKESGGSQTVVNTTDSNARAGHPSQGLLQYIPSTFSKYAAKGKNNIDSGYDQLLALFNDKNWLSDISVSGGWGPSGGTRGYANGTDYAMGGQATVSENNSPEIVSDPYGRLVLSTRQTSFSDFMAGSTVTPLSQLGSTNGVNWNQSSLIMQAVSQLARVSASGASSSGSHTINVKVSGSISGLTKENNDQVANSIAGYFSGSPMAFSFSRT